MQMDMDCCYIYSLLSLCMHPSVSASLDGLVVSNFCDHPYFSFISIYPG